MLADKLVEKDLYLEPISYIKNTKITEYDIKSAGFNIIREYKLIDEEAIEELAVMPKQDRTIAIGKLMKNNASLNSELTKKFAEVRKNFVIQNNIQEEDILSIKKDAIFIIQKEPKVLKLGTFIEFVAKNVYTSFLNLNGIEFYYDGYRKKLDIKNFKKDFNSEMMVLSKGESVNIEIETHPLISQLKHFIALSEKLQPKQVFNTLKNFRNKYLTKQLELENYREIKTGLFTLNNGMQIKFASEENIDEIDISRNYLEFLMPFLGILL